MVRYAVSEDYTEAEIIMKQVQQLHVQWRPDIYRMTEVVLPEEIFLKAAAEKQFLVAERDGKVVGILSYFIRHVQSNTQVARKVLFIDSMAVDETYRGQGVGHELFDYVGTIVKEQNFDGLELQVNARNKEAKAMYEKYGFTEKSVNMELKE